MEQLENEKELNTDVKPKKKGNKLVILVLAVVCVLLVLAAGLFFINNGGKTDINLNDYVEVEFKGYEGYGEAQCSFNKRKFVSEYEEEITFSSKLKKSIEKEDGIGEELAIYCASLDIDIDDPYERDAAELLYYALYRNAALSKTINLCNGDAVELQWEFDE